MIGNLSICVDRKTAFYGFQNTLESGIVLGKRTFKQSGISPGSLSISKATKAKRMRLNHLPSVRVKKANQQLRILGDAPGNPSCFNASLTNGGF